MRIKHLVISCVVLALCLTFRFADAQEGKKKIKATERWTGKISDDKAKVHVPEKGLITKAGPFKKLWEAWRPNDKMPEINWDKKFVLVHLAGGPNIPSTSYTLDADGNLKAMTLSTLIGGPGFGYAIEVLDREGIKTYQGKKIE